jgi:hypothetical protein
VGFSFASFARIFLIENPSTVFPPVLQQMSVFKAQWQSLASDQPEAKKQISVFWWGILIIFIWQFLPAVRLSGHWDLIL